MAVFTQITDEDVRTLLGRYSIGALVSLKEVGQGIENSNYFLTTQCEGKDCPDEWVVTIFETLSKSELPFFLDLTEGLAEKKLPVPAAVKDSQGNAIQEVQGKPLAVFPRFKGDWLKNPDDAAREQVARFIAAMHGVVVNPSGKRKQSRNNAWVEASVALISDNAPTDDLVLLKSVTTALGDWHQLWMGCPVALIHGDLFRDNILFDNQQISGVIDFYHACEDYRLFDLAVAINDWCADDNGELNWPQATLMYRAYNQSAMLTEAEERSWGAMLLLAALRFWLSRLVSRYKDGYQRQATQGDITKDPDEFRRKIHSINKRFELF